MRLAHLSDTHILPGGAPVYGVDSAGRLAQAVDELNAFGADIDVVIFTGDLTDKASSEAYSMLRSILEPLRAPYFLIPGNHDDRELLRVAFEGTGAVPYEPGFANYVVDDFAVRLIGLDSTLEGSDLPEFCEARADWLEHALAAKPNRPTAD